jgi:peptidoglycan/LPS O-acetylase OafA/YrhL
VAVPANADRAAAAGFAIRLPYLDGLRALAAAYVVMFHAVLGFGGPNLSGIGRVLRRALAFGHEAVAVFIVLSGYCLTLPLLSKQPLRLELALGRFARRRAMRILPPYFAALGLSLLLMAVVPALRINHTGTIWDDSFPGLQLWPIVSHLLLVHNLWPAYSVQINGPLWSVATEWQIYFFFPLLLLPCWRRGGRLFLLAVAALVGYLPLLFAPAAAASAGSWYLLLFALGVAAASVGFGSEAERRLQALPWRLIAAASWGLCGVGGMLFADVWFRHKPLTDCLVGLATATLLIHLTLLTALPQSQRGVLLRVLEARPMLALGHFSYSLYLTHLPVVALCYFALRPLGLSPLPFSLLLLLTGSTASLVVAWVFYLVVERPSMLWRRPS